MTINEIIKARGITEILHFTTNHGCLGTLYSKALLSRKRLQNDEMVRYLFGPNAKLRKDVAYLDYVNCSISHINTSFFNICSGAWHRGEPIFWCILAFDPVIAEFPGVWFATTNNMYTGVSRGVGAEGLAALFAPSITRWVGAHTSRLLSLPAQFPTCEQAEILYPEAISTTFLRRIYVSSVNDQSEVRGFLKATFHPEIEVVIDPSKFGVRQT